MRGSAFRVVFSALFIVPLATATQGRAQTTNRQDFQRYEQQQWEDSQRAQAEAIEQQRRLRQQIQQDQLFRQRLERERQNQLYEQQRRERALDQRYDQDGVYAAPAPYNQAPPLYVVPQQPGAVQVVPQVPFQAAPQPAPCRQFVPGYDANGAYIGQVCIP